jgi:hypothetical protein
MATEAPVPLIVDCDRTLTRADMAIEALVAHAKSGWRALLLTLWWLLAGRAGIKTRLARTILSMPPPSLSARKSRH